MIALRILGGLAAVAFLSIAIVRHRRRQISRLSLIISSVLTIGVLLLAIVPDLRNPFFHLLHFRPGSGRRLTALLLAAVAVLFALVIRLQSHVDVNERNMRLLVEAFGRERFDGDAARALPWGRGFVDARRVRARTPDPSRRRPLLLVAGDHPRRPTEHRRVQRVPSHPGAHAPQAG